MLKKSRSRKVFERDPNPEQERLLMNLSPLLPVKMSGFNKVSRPKLIKVPHSSHGAPECYSFKEMKENA